MKPSAFWRGVQSPNTMWTWVSMRPGARAVPLTSTRTSAAAASISARSPIRGTSPASIRTVSASIKPRSRSPLMMRPMLISARLVTCVSPFPIGSRQAEAAHALPEEHADVFDLGVGVQGLQPELTTHAAGLVAAEGRLVEQRHVRVDPNPDRPNLAGHALGALDVAGPDGGG